MTNAEWLRQQGNDELAELIAEGEAFRRVAIMRGYSPYIVKEAIIDWLEAVHEGDDND